MQYPTLPAGVLAERLDDLLERRRGLARGRGSAFGSWSAGRERRARSRHPGDPSRARRTTREHIRTSSSTTTSSRARWLRLLLGGLRGLPDRDPRRPVVLVVSRGRPALVLRKLARGPAAPEARGLPRVRRRPRQPRVRPAPDVSPGVCRRRRRRLPPRSRGAPTSGDRT